MITLSLAALGAGAGCDGAEESTVFVEASIVNPKADVSGDTLGTYFSGTFALHLNLGDGASEASQVSLQSFAVTGADQGTVIVPSLEATTTTAMPVSVGPGSRVIVDMTFDSQANPLAVELKDTLCNPAGIRISGVVQDSLQDGTTAATSDVFTATCAQE